MGAFNINITGVGGHGCERKAKPGEKLYGRCGRFNCPDCLAYDFVQRLRQAGMLTEGSMAAGNEVVHATNCPANNPVDGGDCTCAAVPPGAEVYYGNGKTYWKINQHADFTHWPHSKDAVVDDMLRNERKSGLF